MRVRQRVRFGLLLGTVAMALLVTIIWQNPDPVSSVHASPPSFPWFCWDLADVDTVRFSPPGGTGIGKYELWHCDDDNLHFVNPTAWTLSTVTMEYVAVSAYLKRDGDVVKETGGPIDCTDCTVALWETGSDIVWPWQEHPDYVGVS